MLRQRRRSSKSGKPFKATLLGFSALGLLLTGFLMTHDAFARDNNDQRVSRALLAQFEERFTQGVLGAWKSASADGVFVDPPRAYAVDHFGIVMTSEITLVAGVGPMIFRPAPNRSEIADHRGQVLQRLPQLLAQMRNAAYDMASNAGSLKDDDRLAVAVTVYHFKWEDTAGVPTQIVVQGPRKQLMDARAKSDAERDAALETKEIE